MLVTQVFSPLEKLATKISYNITPESNIKVMRTKEMITKERSAWLLNKLSFLKNFKHPYAYYFLIKVTTLKR